MKEVTNAELRALSVEQLAIKAEELRRELFQMRLQWATAPAKSFPSDKQKLKRSVARVMTEIRQRQSVSEQREERLR
ncbi:MAG: 50S ribosomal protein L29 [Candidatus Babeliaceae bacterium]|nr:50S ribosomal protein L29 [Candidatus Babeliaceae bacterium]